MKFVLKRSLNTVQEMVTWKDVDDIYNEAMNDFEELERAKAECPFWTSPTLAKKIFNDKFEYSVKNRLGTPLYLAREMTKHASEVILACAELTSKKAVTKDVMKETKKNCFVSWNWSPIRGECTIYKYGPLKSVMEGSVIEKENVSCPHDENAYREANEKAVAEAGRRGWLDECLLEVHNLISDVSYENGALEIRSTWDLNEEAKKWYNPWEKKWKELKAKYS